MKYLTILAILMSLSSLQGQEFENFIWKECGDTIFYAQEGGASLQLDTVQNRVYITTIGCWLPLYITGIRYSEYAYLKPGVGEQKAINAEYSTVSGYLSVTWITGYGKSFPISFLYIGRYTKDIPCIELKGWNTQF